MPVYDTGERRRPAEPGQVLIVEDEPQQRDALVRAFRDAGLVALAVPDAFQAFEALRRQDYAAIICDIKMPAQSGVTFYDQLEERLPTLASRVIFVSAYVDHAEVREYLAATGQPFIQKPYDVFALIRTVRDVMERVGR
jgi:CheY-like chemotaxis protein